MRKLLVILSIMVMVFVMTGCGENTSSSPYLGTWSATSAEYNDIEMEITTLFPDGFTITLNDNGKCDVSIDGTNETGKWVESEGGFILEDELSFTVKDKAATLEYEGVSLKFEKK